MTRRIYLAKSYAEPKITITCRYLCSQISSLNFSRKQVVNMCTLFVIISIFTLLAHSEQYIVFEGAASNESLKIGACLQYVDNNIVYNGDTFDYFNDEYCLGPKQRLNTS